VTATEAERNRRRGLTPWWRVRSWSKDLDTLTRLHKSLRALDTDTDTDSDTKQQPFSAPAVLAPPQDGVTGDQVSDPPAPYPPEPQSGEPGLGQRPDPTLEQAVAGPDPAIAAIKETFRYVAEAGDKSVGFFYGQLFLRQPHLRELFPPAMNEQRDRLFRALGRIVESLSTPDEMAAYLSQLGRDHASTCR
jgi:hypothetical protein